MIRAFLLAAALLGSSSLFAEVPASDGPLTAHVSYADLNLANPAGQKVLDARIKRAIGQVCPELNSSVASRLAANHCRREVTAETRRQTAIVVAAAGGKRAGGPMTVAAIR
ncbi:UrcA family protein [Sphingomonas sp.]|uniref:UrcA family protein n=1 Tax=Sphingomonas sp. TaxID=28214 RepID=UPI000DAFD250|nr:UrcA family protein [Sphingomonas sp.]PZU06861.1 MAG: hypothetical protein DI605_17475 [Sphingomonas sp.]